MTQTVTISLNSFFQPSESSLFEGLQFQFGGVYVVEKVDRSFASVNYAVTINNRLNANVEAVKGSFRNALAAMGYKTAEIIKVESGEFSTLPGGIGQIVSDTAKEVTLPLLLVAAIAVAVAAVYLLPRSK